MDLNFVAIGKGKLAIGHRPKIKDIKLLKEQGVTVVLSIQSEKEGIDTVLKEVKKQDLKSIHLPLGHAKVLDDQEVIDQVVYCLNQVKSCLQEGEHVFIHCSAGIHRTGMYTNALLLLMEYTIEEAYEILGKLRDHTIKNVRQDRLIWGYTQFANYQDGDELPF